MNILCIRYTNKLEIMETVDVLEQLFDNKILSVLQLFVENENNQYYLREIAKLTKVSPATTYRILNKLVDLNVLEIQEIKTLKQYILSKNKKTEFLKTVIKKEKRVVDMFVDRIKSLEGIEKIILHGKQTNKKANVLVLGSNVDATQIKLISSEIKEKYDFTILSLTLTNEQYEQMSAMGLYSGEKQVLF